MATNDDPVLQQLFYSISSHDQLLVSDAKEKLDNISLSPSFPRRLLSLISQESIEVSIRHAASIYLENMIEERWGLVENQRDETHHPMAESDKIQVWDNIVSAMLSCSRLDTVLNSLKESVRKIFRCDFSTSWPNLIQQLHVSISSESKENVKVALLVLTEALHVECAISESEIERIYSIFAPMMLQIATAAIKQSSDHDFYLVCLMLKGLKNCIIRDFFQPVTSHFDEWNILLCQVIAMPVPNAYYSASLGVIDSEVNEELENSNFWKMKKSAFKALGYLFRKYLTEYYTSDSYKAFRDEYQSKYAGPGVEACLKSIEDIISESSILPEGCYMHLCSILRSAIENNFTWETYLKANMIRIIQLFLFPRVCSTEEDVTQWRESPEEYIRTQVNSCEDQYKPIFVASIETIISCNIKRCDFVLIEFLSFLSNTLNSSTIASEMEKEGALKVLGYLSYPTSNVDQVLSQIGTLICTTILPILSSESSLGFLKTRAAWTIEELLIKFRFETDVSIACFNALLNCLSTKNELSLRVVSVLALKELIDDKAIQLFLLNDSGILNLAKAILDITDKVKVEQIEIEALLVLIKKMFSMYSEELTPYAVQFAILLVNEFSRNMASVEEKQDPNSKAFDFIEISRQTLALGIMHVLCILVDSMSSNRQIVVKLEPVIVPLVITVFERRVSDVYHNTFGIISALVLIIQSVSPAIWRIFKMILVIYENEKSDFHSTPRVYSTISNIICIGINQAIQDQECLGPFLSMISKTILQEEDIGMREQDYICMILERLYLSTKLMPADVTTRLLVLLNRRIEVEIKRCNKFTAVKITEVVLAILYSNSSFYPLVSTKIWDNLIKDSKHYTRVFDKKLIILSLSQILANLDNPQLLCVYLEAISSLPEAIARHQKLIEEMEKKGNYDESEYISELYHDSLSEDESSESQSLQELDCNKEESSDHCANDDDNSNDSEALLVECADLHTVIDDVDVSEVIKNSIRMISPHLISGISQEQQEFLKSLI